MTLPRAHLLQVVLAQPLTQSVHRHKPSSSYHGDEGYGARDRGRSPSRWPRCPACPRLSVSAAAGCLSRSRTRNTLLLRPCHWPWSSRSQWPNPPGVSRPCCRTSASQARGIHCWCNIYTHNNNKKSTGNRGSWSPSTL